MNHTKIPLLPRRYEDTKPALNQAFTHNAILGTVSSDLSIF